MANQPPWKLELAARLAAERAYLLRQLWALDEATLTTAVVGNGRTPKEIIAHIGGWDSLTVSRLRRVMNGRVHTIDPHDQGQNRADFNAQLHDRYQKHNLKLSLAFALRERSNLLYALDQIDAVALERPFLLPWGEEISLRHWFIRQYEHDAIHAQELETWRKTLPLAQKRQIGPKLVLRAILKSARKELLTLIPLIPATERDTLRVRGDWTLKDLIGHLTDWEQMGEAGLNQLLLGQTPEFTPIEDMNAFDEAHIAARRHQPWAQVWRTFNKTRQTLEDTYQKYPEPFLSHTITAPWGKILPAYFWLTMLFGHDTEHATDVRRTLQLSTWPERFI